MARPQRRGLPARRSQCQRSRAPGGGRGHLQHGGRDRAHDGVAADGRLGHCADAGRDVDVQAARQHDQAGQVHRQQLRQERLRAIRVGSLSLFLEGTPAWPGLAAHDAPARAPGAGPPAAAGAACSRAPALRLAPAPAARAPLATALQPACSARHTWRGGGAGRRGRGRGAAHACRMGMRMMRTRLYGSSCRRMMGGPTNAADRLPM